MADYFAANDLAAFAFSGSPTEVTTAGRFDASYCTKAMQSNANTAFLQGVVLIDPTTGSSVNLTTAWLHVEIFTSTTNINTTAIELINSSGVVVARLFLSSSGQARLDYWNGAAFVTGTLATAFTGTQKATFDLQLVCGATGTFNLYFNNSSLISISGLNAAVTNVASFKLYGAALSYSQVLVSDVSTVGAKVSSLTPNSNGANTAWANDYTNLVKTGYNDVTLVSTSTLGAKETYGATDATLPTNYVISSMWIAIRARLNSSSPVNAAPLVRISSTDYQGSYNFPGLSAAAFGPSLAGFAVDPSTSAAWGLTNLNAAELGFVSTA